MSLSLDISERVKDDLNEWGYRKNLGVLQRMVSSSIFSKFAPFCDEKLGYSRLRYRDGVVFMNRYDKEIKVLKPEIGLYLDDPRYSYSLRPLKEEIFDFLIKASSLLYIFLEQNNALINDPEILERVSGKWVNERLYRFPIIVDDLDLIDTLENFHDRLKAACYSGIITDPRLFSEVTTLKAVYSFPGVYKKEIMID